LLFDMLQREWIRLLSVPDAEEEEENAPQNQHLAEGVQQQRQGRGEGREKRETKCRDSIREKARS
jgi:hypothetical protein